MEAGAIGRGSFGENAERVVREFVYDDSFLVSDYLVNNCIPVILIRKPINIDALQSHENLAHHRQPLQLYLRRKARMHITRA